MVACWLALAGETTAAGIYKTDVEISPASEVVVLHLDAAVAPTKDFVLENPPRVVIDLPAGVSGEGVGLSPSYPGQMIRNIRFGKPTPEASRVVIDLATNPGGYKVMGSMSPPRIAIHLPLQAGASSAAVRQPHPQPQATSQAPFWRQPEVPAQSSKPLPPAPELNRQAETPQVLVSAPTPRPKPVAELKEAQKPMVVIDAGHGGKDTGAIALSGTHEKNITLGYAGALKEALLRTGRYRVELTRGNDTYLFLHERVKIARDHKAVVFISLHADSNPNPKASGLSIYTISDQASDEESAALAAQENKSDIIGGIDLSVEDKNVADILIDMAQRETRGKGSHLAETLIANMHPKIPLLSNTHRYAGFRVLKAPDVPSVLIEIGFLSNPRDEKLLQTIEYKDKFTRSVVDGLNAYFGM